MDATTTFFEDLNRRGHDPLLEKVNGTIRFDLARDGGEDHVYVTVRKGDIAVSDGSAGADFVVRAGRDVFNGIASGERNAMASVLRGALAFEGDPQMFLRFQRLFPGPPQAGSQKGGRS